MEPVWGGGDPGDLPAGTGTPELPCPAGTGEPSKEGNTVFSLNLLPIPGMGGYIGPEGIPGVVFSGVGAAAGGGGKAQGMGFAGRQRPVCIYEEDCGRTWPLSLAAIAAGACGGREATLGA